MADVREYADPTPAWVRGAVRGGVEDPRLLVDGAWTDAQKRKWSAQFNVLLKAQRSGEGEAKSAAHEQDVAALQLAYEQPPVARDVAAGVFAGGGDVLSLGLRGADVLNPNPPIPTQESLADTANRALAERERVTGLAGRSDPLENLPLGIKGQTAVRGASRAMVMGAVAAPAGPLGVIGAFSADRANKAVTEAKDAGLTGREAADYVGRAALIQGSVSAVLHGLGAGGRADMFTGGLTKESVGGVLRQAGVQVGEQATIGVLDAYNQAASGLTGPVTEDQLVEIFKDSATMVLLTAGAHKLGGLALGDGREARLGVLADSLSQDYGWPVDRTRVIIDRAARRGGDFQANLGHEVRTEVLLKPEMLAFWAYQNMDAARALANTPNPSRAVWEEAGLPRASEEDRAAAVGHLRGIMQILDVPAAAPATDTAALTSAPTPRTATSQDAGTEVATPPPAVEPPVAARAATPPEPSPLDRTATPSAEVPLVQPNEKIVSLAGEAARRAEAKSEGLAAPPSFTERRRQQQAAEVAATFPGSTTWRTADAETLRGLLKDFKIPEAEHAAAVDRLNLLENPIAKGADWRTADADELTALLKVKAVDPAEAKEAQARLRELRAGLKLEAVAQVPADTSPPEPEPAKSVGLKPPPVEKPAAEKPKAKTAGTLALAETLAGRLKKGEPTDWRALKELADQHYGGTLGEHAYELQDAYEAVELALSKAGARDARVDLEQAKKTATELGKLLDLVPTQTTRSASKLKLQQFSTPTDYAFAANWVANLKKGDVVLEPSAGTGNLAAHAVASGVRVVGNEIDPRRAELLKAVASEVHSEDAKQIADILGPKGVKPTVVVMNPPFSADKNRAGKKNLMEAAQHIEAALAILPQGGRLVAIVGRGMSEDSPTFSRWFDKIGESHDVRANVEVSGDVYAKMGTDFGTRLLVIDKDMPDHKSPTVTGSVDSVSALLDKLEGVRNDRPTVGAPDREAIGEAPARPEGAAERVGAVSPPPVAPDVGGQPAGGGGTAGAAEGVRAGHPPVAAGAGTGGLPPGGRPERGPGEQPGRAPNDVAGPPAQRDAGEPAGVSTAAAPVETKGLNVQAADRVAGEDQGTYEGYRPAVRVKGAKEHPTPLVESAAMASVDAPKVVYEPKIDQKLIDDGVLSEAQLEPVVYAGAAHEQTIPMSAAEQEEFRRLSGQEPPTEKRRGYFVGDGTGVGKGRIAAAVILDNMNQGRAKAVWISEGKKLFQAAIRDWTAVGGKKKDLKGLHQVEAGEPVKHGDGILFGTYTTLGKEAPAEKEGETKRLARIEQIVQWAGPKFDGVLVFDESHNAANAVEAKGARGTKKASNMALATVELQRRLPNARVLYMSATGATQVNNLAYADRLGLWGEGTQFANREAFLNSVSAGGVAAMELVARDMKAQGMYGSRTLSFKGVDYSRLTHKLEPDQVRMYDNLSEAWQAVLRNIHEALALTGPDGKADATQKRNAMGQFWGAQQRFFNQVLTALQMPTVLKALHEDLEAGKAPVIQIVNTMEAATERALKKAKAEAAEAGEPHEDLADVDLTPRDALVEMVNNAFPIHKYESFTNEDGNTESRPVLDSEGKPVVSQEAVKLKEQLLEKLADVRVPDAPIDQIINEFGYKKVAEVTGRGRRVVRTGQGLEREEQKRSTPAVLEDIRAFMDGERDLLVFSQAGATGESYHADLSRENQKQRRHYVLQAGWRADKAVQGLGRSHRSNQANTPEFRLVETDLPGHKRFISTIAKRLEQLGALTRGQRTAGGGGLFSEADNLEGTHAQDALYGFLMDVIDGKVEGVGVHDFEEQTGLKLLGDEGSSSSVRSIEIKQFLNRMLSLKVDMQHKVFEAYADRLETAVEAARQNGTLDVGMETIRANRIEKVSEQTVRKDERSGAPTKYVELKAFYPTERHEFDDVMKRVESKGDQVGFVRNNKSGRVYVVVPAGTTTEGGKLIDLSVRWGPGGRIIVPTDKLYATHGHAYEAAARADWNEALAALPDEREERIHLITGALLPVWNSITGKPRVRRATTDKGERFLGRVVEEGDIGEVLQNLGVNRKVEIPEAKEARDLLMTGGSLQFANGWTISRKQIQGEPHFEVGGNLRYGDGQLIVDMGGRRDMKGGRARWFIPTGEGFAPVYERLRKGYEVSKVNRPGAEERQLAPAGPDDRPSGGGGQRARPLLDAGLDAPAPDAPAGAARPLSAVDVTHAIERLYPQLAVKGPATFRRAFQLERAKGWYTPALGEIRTKERYDVVTMIHELGHHFDRELGKWSKQAGHEPGVDAELAQLGKDLYGDRKPKGGYRSEGFAEFVREYLSGSGDLQARAPTVYRWWTTEHLAENPADAAKINELGGLVQRLLAQTPQENIEALMAPVVRRDWSAERFAATAKGVAAGGAVGFASGGPAGAAMGAVIGGFVGADPNREANYRDSLMPLLRAEQASGLDLDRLSPLDRPYMVASGHARTAGGETQHAFNAQTTDLHGIETGQGFRDTLAPIADQGPEVFKAWKEYALAKVIVQRKDAHPGWDAGISRADAEAIVKEHEGKPGFRATLEAWSGLAHRSLEPLVQAGVMTGEEFTKIASENPFYVKMLRQVAIENAPGEAGAAGGGRRGAYRLTERGSKLPIHDFVDAQLLEYERIRKVAHQGNVVRALVKVYDEAKKAGHDGAFLGKFLSEVPLTTKATSFDAAQIRKAVLEGAGEHAEEVDKALEEFWDDRLTVFTSGSKPTGRNGKNTIATVIDGVRRNFEVKPDLLPILEGVTQTKFLAGQLGVLARKATALQRLGATGLNEQFGLVRNMFRDTLMATVTGDYHDHLPVISTVRGMWRNLSDSEYARRYRAQGLGHMGELGQDVQAAEGLSKTLGPPGAIGRLVRPWLPPGLRDVPVSLDGLREVIGQTEPGPRIMEFEWAHKAAMEKYGDERVANLIANLASQDLTVDFRRGGNILRQVNEVVLFPNAQVQSADKLLRAMGALEAKPWASTQDRRATAVRTLKKGALFLTATALMLYFKNRGDRDWEELPQHYKWGYLNYKLPGGGWFHVPLPYDTGAVFGSLPVAMLEGPKAFEEALRFAVKSNSPLDLDGMHGLMRNVALLAPMADAAFNKDWKGAPIIPNGFDENRVPSDQYGPNVSGLARLLGAAAPGGMSPAVIDHLLDGYTGGLYRRMSGKVSALLDPSAIQPLDDPSTFPILGTLFLRPGTSRVVGDFYDRLHYLKQRQGSQIATLEEQGELRTAEHVNRSLHDVWSKRRDAINSDASAGNVKTQTEALLNQAEDLIRAHNQRATESDRAAGLGGLLHKATGPHAPPEELPVGLTEEEAVAALRAEALRRGERIRVRDDAGNLTAFGQRQARLIRALRNKMK